MLYVFTTSHYVSIGQDSMPSIKSSVTPGSGSPIVEMILQKKVHRGVKQCTR